MSYLDKLPSDRLGKVIALEILDGAGAHLVTRMLKNRILPEDTGLSLNILTEAMKRVLRDPLAN